MKIAYFTEGLVLPRNITDVISGELPHDTTLLCATANWSELMSAAPDADYVICQGYHGTSEPQLKRLSELLEQSPTTLITQYQLGARGKLHRHPNVEYRTGEKPAFADLNGRLL